MKNLRALLAVGFLSLGLTATLRADDALRHFQQSLHDQGFYYGPVDGSPGDETTQSLKRYQIRNGLPVTGQLDDETRQSIDRTGKALAESTRNKDNERRATPQPTPGPLATPSDSRSTLTGKRPVTTAPTPNRLPPSADDADSSDDDREARPAPRDANIRPDLRAAPAPRGSGVAPSAALTAFFEETPFEFAPPPVQADVLRRAQTNLLHSGFYDGETDGRPGPEISEALSNYQEVNHLRRSGRLDTNTLGALRLLPARRGGPPGAVYEGRIVR